MAGIFSLLLAFSIVMGAYSTISMPSIEGFGESDIHVPGDFAPLPLPEPPSHIAGNTTARPNIMVRMLIGQVFEMYGGSVRILISNNDTRAFFLEELRFEWVGIGLDSAIMVNQRIPTGTTYVINALAIDGPPVSGPRDYQLSIRLLQFRNNQWYRMLSGGDEWLTFSEQTIDVMPIFSGTSNPVSVNPRSYFGRVNDLVEFSTPGVINATVEATAALAGGYDMGKVSAIFDWLVTNINYTEDPDGGDAWYSPEETLAMRAGDCEDYAMLLAAMVEHAGGTSRIYLTIDHAFAAVYVGNTSFDLDNASADIRAFYRTHLPIHYFSDEAGYWVVADPLGSFYMGGLAVGQEPISFADGYWVSGFPDSGTLYSIDVTGTSAEQPLWLDPLLWMGMIIVFGFLALGYAVSAYSEKPQEIPQCPVCSANIGEDIYTCPACQTKYHRSCAFMTGHCRVCQAPIRYLPP